MSENITNIKNDSQALKKEIREKTLGYILTAFGLVAGLAWNEAIKGLIEHFFPISGGGLLIKFMYAVIITVVVVIIAFYLGKLMKKEG